MSARIVNVFPHRPVPAEVMSNFDPDAILRGAQLTLVGGL